MEYIHIKNIDHYHPGYQDRELKWAKVYFTMVQGDPEFEMVDSEIVYGNVLVEVSTEKYGKVFSRTFKLAPNEEK